MIGTQLNITYALLAVALSASLLYQPVTAADPTPALGAPSSGQPDAGVEALPDEVRQDFDALVREIEAGTPPADQPTADASDELQAARIHIGVLQQAVVTALAARAEAEAKLEAHWRDSRAEIDALKAARAEGTTRISALETELADAKGELDRLSSDPASGKVTEEVQAAAFQPSGSGAAEPAPAAGPTELMLNEIHFDPGSAELTPGGTRKALDAAARIKTLGASNVRVAGYTDTLGPAAYNMHLSLQRARSIVDLLASVGVSSEIIQLEGNGEEGAPEPTEDQVSEPLNRCAGIFALVDLPTDQPPQ